jgi:hypothetical protein
MRERLKKLMLIHRILFLVKVFAIFFLYFLVILFSPISFAYVQKFGTEDRQTDKVIPADELISPVMSFHASEIIHIDVSQTAVSIHF